MFLSLNMEFISLVGQDFYAPRDRRSKIGGYIVFVLFVILSETLTLLITFEQWVPHVDLWYFTWIFKLARLFRRYQHFWPWTFTFFKNINLLITLKKVKKVSARALIFYMNISWDKALRWVPTIMTLTLEFDLLFENFNIAKNFWTMSARVYKFHKLNISIFFILWPWPSRPTLCTIFLKH